MVVMLQEVMGRSTVTMTMRTFYRDYLQDAVRFGSLARM